MSESYQALNRLERYQGIAADLVELIQLIQTAENVSRQYTARIQLMIAKYATAPPLAPEPSPLAPPNTDPELESANRKLANALGIADPTQRIGVYDYNSLVECLTVNFEIAFPPTDPTVHTDPQNMVQLMAAEIQHLRRKVEEYQNNA